MGPQFLDLPGEIVVLILSFLPLRDITACKRSCWQLRGVIKQSGLLRCRVRTMKNFIEDLSPPSLSTADFLECLKRWEKAWLTFGVGKEIGAQTTSLPYRGRSEFLMRSGYLIEMRYGEGPGLSYLDLSSQCTIDGVQSPLLWTEVELANTNIGGWALDIDQNLLAVALLTRPARKQRLEIRFLHFLTGTPHHSTSLPGIHLKFEGKYDYYFGTHMEIMGDNIAVLITHGSLLRRYQTLYLVNWVQGRIECRRRTRVGTYFPAVTSISEDILVLARKRDWALELCKITRDDTHTSTFFFWTLCTLQLPPVHPKTRTDLTSFNRAPSGSPGSSFATPRSTALPFRSSPLDSVLAFAVTVSRRGKDFAEFRRLFFYVLPSTLRSLVAVIVGRAEEKGPKARSTSSNWLRWRAGRAHLPPPPIVVPWVDWGTRTTRWVIPSVDFPRQTLSGMRCAFVDRGWTLRVLDFNPGRLRRVVAVRENGKEGEKALIRLAVTNTSTISAGQCFLQDVISGLPYYELKRNGVKGQFVMDDEWIAQIEVDSVSMFEPGGYGISVHPVLGTNSSDSQ